MAKTELPLTSGDAESEAKRHEVQFMTPPKPRSRIGRALRLILVLSCIVILTSKFDVKITPKPFVSLASAAGDVCPQAAPLVPTSPLMAELDEEYATEGFKARAINALSGAVQIPYVAPCLQKYTHPMGSTVPRCGTTWNPLVRIRAGKSSVTCTHILRKHSLSCTSVRFDVRISTYAK